jgi:SWI/SNF-related matrix-associated actin-dependent regulator 1 of chromatin subfamily A
MLDKKEWGSAMSFGRRYCGARRTYWGWQFKGATHIKELNQRLLDFGMIRRLKVNVLKDLPAKTRTVIPVDISRRKEYDEAEKDFISWLRKKNKSKAKRAESANAMVKHGYLKRLVAELKMKQTKIWIYDFLKNTDGKLVVFAIHKKIIKMLEDEFTNFVTITGKTNQKDRRDAVYKFQTDKETRLFFGNLQAAGSGITLTAASTVLFTELGWTPGEHLQAEDRPHRIGQKDNVQCVYLVGKNTIEERLCRILQERQEVLLQTIDGKENNVAALNIYDQLENELIGVAI